MADTAALASELFEAGKDGEARVVAPSARGENFDMDAAYGVESAIVQMHSERGGRTAGVKVGYANKAMWRVLKIDTLVWAHMYEHTVQFANGGAAELALPYYRAPKIEPEIVFKLKRPVAAGADGAGALEAVEWIAPGFEIIDIPFSEPQFQPVDFVAAYGLHLALVVGAPLHVEAAMIPDLVEALAKFKVRLLKNGELVEEGGGRNSLRSPALCLAELSGAMARREGAAPLVAGDLVSSGTLTSGSPVAKGEVWSVEAEGLPVSGLSLRLE